MSAITQPVYVNDLSELISNLTRCNFPWILWVVFFYELFFAGICRGWFYLDLCVGGGAEKNV